MQVPALVSRFTLASALLATMAIPARATTLMREGLDQLTAKNELVVQGRVLDTNSHWNDGHTLIFTDVKVRPSQVLKGRQEGDVTFTVLGGTVGDVTTLIIGGAELLPGSDYVLFLSHADLPGAANRLTVRDHAQGAFNVDKGRAFSEAFGDPLLPDGEGRIDVPGGEDGLPIEELTRQVRAHQNR